MTTLRGDISTFIKIHEFFKSANVLKPTGEGTCVYNGNWSDAGVARQLGCKPASVASVRKQTYGVLIVRAVSNNGVDELKNRLDEEMKACNKNFDQLALENKGLENAITNIERRMQFIEAWARNKGYMIPNGRMHKESA